MLTKSSLSPPRKRLIETMQRNPYCRIQGLWVCGGEPVFDPPPRIVRDLKIGALDSGERPELQAQDFVLKREHVELFEHLKLLRDGVVECIEVKAGLPFRLSIEQRV